MPMRVIAKKRCRAMFEPPEKCERATLNPNLSTRLNLLFFRSGPWAAGWLLLVGQFRPMRAASYTAPDFVAASYWSKKRNWNAR
jgi:hypothetical protein